MPTPHAFDEHDYRDHRTDEQRAAERAATEVQVTGLKRLTEEPGLLRSVVGRLQERRGDRPRRIRFEMVQVDDRTSVLVATGSVVATAERMPADLYKALAGVVPVTNYVCRRLDVSRAAAARTMPEVVQDMRRHLADVQVDHILPLAGHIKGGGGPEPSTGARQYGEVWFPKLQPSPVIAVLDTGISAERRGDEFLAMRVDSEDVDPLDELGRAGYLDAAAGHGAFVAGIVEQVAPGADIRIYRAVDSDGIATDTGLAELMRTAIADGATILNLSLGSATVDGEAPPAVADVVQQNPDVLVVCAAGNGGDDVPVWPARLAKTHDNVVSVAALDPAGDIADWSSRGDATFSAIGEGVVSTYVIGREDGALVGDPFPDEYGRDSWALWTGTSFAAPQITGALARIMMSSERPLSVREAVTDLRRRGVEPDAGDGYGTRVRILPGT
jgi:hypothetical protein